MAEMTDDEEIKNMLMAFSKTESKHHEETRQFIDMLRKIYGEIVEET